ncbi:hypothetical protein P7C70_g8002, partial [Phenoliferia sp. Uapishka_3]
MPLFEGQNISRFLKRYEMEFRSRGHGEETMAKYLPMYVNQEWFTMIGNMPGCETLKQSMKDAFVDEEKHKYSLATIRKFVSKLKQQGKPDKLSKISRTYFKFTGISSYLKSRSIIGPQEESRYFLSILPEEIVDLIHGRRDTRRLVKKGENNNDEDDEGCALPALSDIRKEVRGIYADFARRGKLSKIRSCREVDSDSDSDSDYSDLSDIDVSDSSDDDEVYSKSKKTRSRSSRSSYKRGKTSKASDSNRGHEKTKESRRKEEIKPKEDPMKDFLLKFSELQVTVAQLAIQAQNGIIGGNQQPQFARRNSFGNGNRPSTGPQGPTQSQNPNAGQWNAPRRDQPPHESNTAAYEATYQSNYTGTGSNATPITQNGPNQWGNRPTNASNGGPPQNTGNFGPSAGSSSPVNGPFTPNGETFAPRPPSCLWCAGEDGDPHWLYACADLTKAINDGIVRRDNEGKIRYGSRFIPGRGHPRGMRAWVREQEELAKVSIQEANERNKERVRFGKDVQVNSVEYDPAEIEESTKYESGNVRVDEYEVNQTKRPRSETSGNAPPPKIRTPRGFRAQENLFEDLGAPRPTKPVEKKKDVEMKDAPKPRAAPAATRPKMESAVESKSDPREFLDKLLQQPITLPISIILANSPELAKLMVAECRRKRATLSEHGANYVGWDSKEEEYPTVNTQSYEGNKQSYYAGVLAFANITVEGETIKALLDNGSMICMMQEEVRKRLGLPIRTDGSHRVRMAGGGLEALMGISENVPVRIGGVTTYVHFFISKGSSNPILLGQNFLCQVEARFSYHADGLVMMGMTYKGRRITVEVTGKDESRYLSHVPGESRDYDSAMVAMVGPNHNDQRMGSFCTYCGPAHLIRNNERSCKGQHAHPTRIDRPPIEAGPQQPSHGPEGNTYSTRQVVKKRELQRSYTFQNFHSSPTGKTGNTSSRSEETSPTPTEAAGQFRGETSARRQRSRKQNLGHHLIQGPLTPTNTNTHTPPIRMEVDRPAESGITITIHQRKATEPVRYETIEILRGLTICTLHNEPPEILKNRQQKLIAAAAEEAIVNERARQEELRKQLGERTAPWIETCTPEEAETRAQELRDEYDRFLEVLFGGHIRLEKKLKAEWTNEETQTNTRKNKGDSMTESPDAHPHPEYPPTAPRKQSKCGSMMLPTHTLRRCKSIDMVKFTHEFRNIPGNKEVEEEILSTIGTTSETLPFDMDDWIDAKVAKEVEDKIEGGPDEAYERRCEDTNTTGHDRPKVVNETAEKAIIEELGLGISNNLTQQPNANTESLMSISELGTLIEGCVFTANLVELVNPEESFMLEDDWPNPRDEEDTESSNFDMDDDYYYGMVEGMADIHVSSEDESSRMEDDREESASAYEASPTDLSEAPIFVDGKWRTFELDSNMSENKELEGSRIVV